MLAGSLWGVMGSRNWDVGPFQVGMSEGERIAKGGLDREAEEIADPSGVTAAGVDLLGGCGLHAEPGV